MKESTIVAAAALVGSLLILESVVVPKPVARTQVRQQAPFQPVFYQTVDPPGQPAAQALPRSFAPPIGGTNIPPTSPLYTYHTTPSPWPQNQGLFGGTQGASGSGPASNRRTAIPQPLDIIGGGQGSQGYSAGRTNNEAQRLGALRAQLPFIS